MTGKIAAKADRNSDPFEYIDDLRDEVVLINEWRETTNNRLQTLENAERDRWTRTEVWNHVKEKLEAETIDWVKWAIRTAFCGVGTAMLAGLGWIIVRIFHT